MRSLQFIVSQRVRHTVWRWYICVYVCVCACACIPIHLAHILQNRLSNYENIQNSDDNDHLLLLTHLWIIWALLAGEPGQHGPMCPLCSLPSKLSRRWSSQTHDSEREDRQRHCGWWEPASRLPPLAKASQMAKAKIKVCGMGKQTLFL